MKGLKLVFISPTFTLKKLIIEIKAMEGLREEHEFQLINYLRATDVEIGLLLNFVKKAEFRCKIFQNRNKKSIPMVISENPPNMIDPRSSKP